MSMLLDRMIEEKGLEIGDMIAVIAGAWIGPRTEHGFSYSQGRYIREPARGVYLGIDELIEQTVIVAIVVNDESAPRLHTVHIHNVIKF